MIRPKGRRSDEARETTQVLVLWGVVSTPMRATFGISGTARSPRAARRARRRVSAAGSPNAQNRDYFRGPEQRGAGAGMARRASGVLAPSSRPKPPPALQEDSSRKALKHHANQTSSAAGCVTRCLGCPTGGFDWVNRPLHRQCVTRGHRQEPPGGCYNWGTTSWRERAVDDDQTGAVSPSGCARFRRSSAGSISAWCVSGISSAVMRRRRRCTCFWSRWPTPRG